MMEVAGTLSEEVGWDHFCFVTPEEADRSLLSVKSTLCSSLIEKLDSSFSIRGHICLDEEMFSFFEKVTVCVLLSDPTVSHNFTLVSTFPF